MSAVLRLIRPERSDESLLAGFLLGRPPTTQRVYRNEVRAFLDFSNKGVLVISASDLRGYVEQCRKPPQVNSKSRESFARSNFNTP